MYTFYIVSGIWTIWHSINYLKLNYKTLGSGASADLETVHLINFFNLHSIPLVPRAKLLPLSLSLWLAWVSTHEKYVLNMLKLQGTVLGIGASEVQSWTGHSPLKWSRWILSLLVARTRIKKCSLLFLFSLLIILQNAGNSYLILLPLTWRAQRLGELKNLPSGPDWKTSGQGQDLTCFPWAPGALWRVLDLSDATASVVSGFLSSHTQLGAADIRPQFLFWTLTCSSSMILWAYGVCWVWVTAKGLAFLF